jgi:deoxyribodipyrimidine photo-lyase
MAKPQGPVVVWFREDLRLSDHPPLTAAVESGRPIIPLYVLDATPERRPLGGASLWWLDKSLRAHGAALEALGSRLTLRRGPAVETVLALVDAVGAGAVVWTRSVEAFGKAQNAALTGALAERGVGLQTFNSNLLHDPERVRTGAGAPFRMYAAFRNAVAPSFGGIAPLPCPERLEAPEAWPDSDDLDAWSLHPTKPDWSTGFSDWRPGEAGARERLDRFLLDALGAYDAHRNLPHVEGTTRLSPHLRFGEISPRQILCAAKAAAAARPELEAAEGKLSFEVAWREFHYHLLAHNPDMAERALRPQFERFPFRQDAAALAAWTGARTGYPIVDAGLRQLWTTGWMHNRVRLIAASFLVKHLLIDWREGERWFWDTLVDADPANNPASWQWVAGAGIDAAPYFRIFNPVIQAERFDPEGEYVRRYVPELARLPTRYLNAPWAAPKSLLAEAGVQLGRDYPEPIVDHAFARKRALDALATLKTET